MSVAIVDVGELTEWEAFGIVRRRAGVTQVALAEASGIHQTRISAWERHGYALPSEGVSRVWAALAELQEAA